MSSTKKQIRRFIIAGICAVSTDMLFYYILSMFLALSLSKAISFMLGTVVAYIINKFYTFEQKEKSYREMFKFFLLYCLTLSANVAVNKLFLWLGSYTVFDRQFVKLFAVLAATGTSTVLNFLGQKFFVFRRGE